MEPTTTLKVLPPRQDCPDSPDCLSEPQEIGHICSHGPICGTCVAYRVRETSRGLLTGACRIRGDRGEFTCTAPICDSYVPRAGAVDAKGRRTDGGPSAAAQIARAAGLALRGTGAGRARSVPVSPPVRVRIPDGPVGELEMTREELKALIREAMDEERGGGGEAVLAPKWEGGMVVLKPADPNSQAKELPLDALLHKVVMIRDRLRVLEQKLNSNAKLTDAEKVDLQSYITSCYGSLTTFNVLFKDAKVDGFVGSGGKDK